MESQYHQLMMMMMKVVAMIFHLQLLSSLLVPVDEAKPHGGGVGVEQLKLVMVMVTMIMVMVMMVMITVVMEAPKIPSSPELR